MSEYPRVLRIRSGAEQRPTPEFPAQQGLAPRAPQVHLPQTRKRLVEVDVRVRQGDEALGFKAVDVLEGHAVGQAGSDVLRQDFLALERFGLFVQQMDAFETLVFAVDPQAVADFGGPPGVARDVILLNEVHREGVGVLRGPPGRNDRLDAADEKRYTVAVMQLHQSHLGLQLQQDGACKAQARAALVDSPPRQIHTDDVFLVELGQLVPQMAQVLLLHEHHRCGPVEADGGKHQPVRQDDRNAPAAEGFPNAHRIVRDARRAQREYTLGQHLVVPDAFARLHGAPHARALHQRSWGMRTDQEVAAKVRSAPRHPEKAVQVLPVFGSDGVDTGAAALVLHVAGVQRKRANHRGGGIERILHAAVTCVHHRNPQVLEDLPKASVFDMLTRRNGHRPLVAVGQEALQNLGDVRIFSVVQYRRPGDGVVHDVLQHRVAQCFYGLESLLFRSHGLLEGDAAVRDREQSRGVDFATGHFSCMFWL